MKPEDSVMIQRYDTPVYDELGMQSSDTGEWVKWEDVQALLAQPQGSTYPDHKQLCLYQLDDGSWRTGLYYADTDMPELGYFGASDDTYSWRRVERWFPQTPEVMEVHDRASELERAITNHQLAYNPCTADEVNGALWSVLSKPATKEGQP